MRWDFSLYKKVVASFRDYFITTTGVMGSPSQENPSSATDNNLTKIIERAPTTQVMTFKGFSMQKLFQVMQAVAMRSCSKACQFFCLPAVEKRNDSPDQTLHRREEKNAQDRLTSPPPTVLIINISNSTMVNCVIGDSHPSAAAERRPLMEDSEQQKAVEVSCSCCQSLQEAAQAAPSEPPHPLPAHQNIIIHSSCLSNVIVGDNNYMHVQQDELLD
ncbi:uncharacterized protein LOC116716902 [Xiphophorus hellerii]|uniref:uncharacterized protein LOC116716902 n=1 Tax=Xiphophorus hellerii TaxID=8084 RepID=UPI0013B46C9D|nr:uncharacterized protein LOC116716902 [Xiphophorus hellerii]